MCSTVSYLLFAYNHERFIEAALRSALGQDYEQMEIIVTDDCSTDGTAATIQRVLADYRGLKPVRFLRNPANLGPALAINNAVALAKGGVLIGAAGDDESILTRTSRIAAVFVDNPQTAYVWSNAEVIDESGRPHGLWNKKPFPRRTLASFLEPKMAMLGATAAFRRDVFEKFGALASDLVIEDRVIPFRAAILGDLTYIDEPLVRYRRHDENISNNSKRSVADIPSWYAILRRHADYTVVALQNRLGDIHTAKRIVPHKIDELRRIERATKRNVSIFSKERFLATHPDARLPTKIAVTLTMLRYRPSSGYVKSWIAIFFRPRKALRRQLEANLLGHRSSNLAP